ncbi:sensor histidine kinase [uncultured Friedmanniella sp.]|uniref:sensor histidine kinase n=1 Tax=uncultured Friedmanniella sp. TaxID=335381 RepID=UPI0035C9F539
MGRPGLAVDLHRLVETYRAAGVEVGLETDADTSRLPLLVRGTLYRVVQEALANAARYRTPGSPVKVCTTVDPGGVTVSVANAGAPTRPSSSGGYGLTGLREQVSAIGGTLRSGPDGGRWLVECRLPQDASAVRPTLVTP